MFKKTYQGILTLMLLTTGLLLGNASYAALGFPTPLLNPTFVTPDIVGNELQISYTPGIVGTSNSLLTITSTGGSSGALANTTGCSSVSCTINSFGYSLTADLDATTNALLSGTVTITGGISTGGFNIPTGSTLVTATLTAFGTDFNPLAQGDQSGNFDFLANVTSYYNGTGGNLGFGPKLAVVYGSQNLDPEFDPASPFTGTGSADNATAVMPEPGTLILLATGGLALCGVRRRYPAAN